MEIQLPFKQEKVTVSLDETKCAGVLLPNEVPRTHERELLLNALKKPHGKPSFQDFCHTDNEILVIVNDATRPTPTAKILEFLESDLPIHRCRFLVATGSHRAPDETELRWIFGHMYEQLADNDQISIHDARDEKTLISFGKSSNDSTIYLNRLVKKASHILVLTTVEPHYFAGYTGGRKSFLPGVSGYETITNNHKQALDPRATTLKLVNNPVHEEMESCMEHLQDKVIFGIHAVLDRYRQLYKVATGDIRLSFEEAVKYANEVFCVNIKERAEIVVSAAPYPMDIDLYQSQKAIENAKPAVLPGGIIILLSSCRTGIGPDTFYNLLSSCDRPEDVYQKIDQEYRLGYHKASKMVESCINGQVWAVTELAPDLLKNVFIKPFSSIQQAVETALAEKGENARIYFIPEGSITVPRLA